MVQVIWSFVTLFLIGVITLRNLQAGILISSNGNHLLEVVLTNLVASQFLIFNFEDIVDKREAVRINALGMSRGAYRGHSVGHQNPCRGGWWPDYPKLERRRRPICRRRHILAVWRL